MNKAVTNRAQVYGVRVFSRFLLLLAVLAMAACQSIVKESTSSGESDAKWLQGADFFEQKIADYSQLSRWRYGAKVGIKTPKLQEQANLVWQFADQYHDVRLFGPLGVGAIKLEFDDHGVRLSDNQGVLHRGDSAEDLLTKIVGWPIPLDALTYWLQGLPYPQKSYEYQANESGDLSRLRQLNWEVKYVGHRQYGEQRLARKITATKSVSPKQTITVKLITKSWRKN